MKVYMILDFDKNDKSRVHTVYLHKEKAEERIEHLIRAQESNKLLQAKDYHSYHVIKKTVKGNLQKALKKGLVK